MTQTANIPGITIVQSPASPTHYDKGRNGHHVSKVVIHVADGTYQGSLEWFRDPRSSVSAHYIVSSLGEIAQAVSEADTAWQAGDYLTNETTIGIEHEGRPALGPWTPTAAQLEASAALVADICKRYAIRPSLGNVVPHSSINPKHNCPGPTWPWAKYIQMVSAILNPPAPPSPPAVAPTAHSPETGKRTITLYDPATNSPVGLASLIDGTSKAYLQRKGQP